MNSFILLIIGLILIFLEFFLPGAIMGITGGVLVLLSMILYALQSDSALETSLFIIAAGIAVGLIIKYALWKIPRSKSNFYSDKDQEGFQASKYDTSVIGRKGIVLSDLKPGGYITIEGKQHQAISQEGYIVKGAEVIVVGGEEESLIVKHVRKE